MIDLTEPAMITNLSSLKVEGTDNVEFIDMLSSSNVDKDTQGQGKDESIIQMAPQNCHQAMAITPLTATSLQLALHRHCKPLIESLLRINTRVPIYLTAPYVATPQGVVPLSKVFEHTLPTTSKKDKG